MSYVGAGGAPPEGCVFCSALAAPDDRKNLVLHRAPHAFLILNTYPTRRPPHGRGQPPRGGARRGE